MQQTDVLIVGGGAAGFFTAINISENYPDKEIILLERGKEVLTKVRISGGGRCNVTHACFDPKDLVTYYPRGEKELLGPFHQFACGDTMAWFEERGVALKIEEDGRIFPESNSSQTIIDCFLQEVQRKNISVKTSHSVKHIQKQQNTWHVTTDKGDFSAEKLVLTTGSNPKIWKLLENLGHQIVPAVPSLFTFNSKDARIKGLAGIATNTHVRILDTKLASEGPLLITHWGMSGPGILKLSAWGARILAEKNYQFQLEVNWLDGIPKTVCLEKLREFKNVFARKTVLKSNPYQLPKRLWQRLASAANIDSELQWASITKQQLQDLASQLTEAVFHIQGKSTFKEEFVTAGGVALKEINFKTFESRKLQNLYLAGEILNIDAITGGFNFQNAWTGSYLIAQHLYD